jgi:hypothetical protein
MKAINKIYFVSIFVAITISIASASYCPKCDGGDQNAICTCATEL